MTKSELVSLKAKLDAYTREALASPETARQTLIREGLYNADGRLSESYR